MMRNLTYFKRWFYKYKISQFNCSLNKLYNLTENCSVFSTINFRKTLDFKTNITESLNETIEILNIHNVISILDQNPFKSIGEVVLESNGVIGIIFKVFKKKYFSKY
jgi:hypothetical protein